MSYAHLKDLLHSAMLRRLAEQAADNEPECPAAVPPPGTTDAIDEAAE